MIIGHIGALFGYVVPFLFVLTIVVFFHEMGHFLVGRWCGVKVDVFSLGFGKELAGFNDRHGTRWRIAAVPLGGYVKFHGDANAASVPASQDLSGMAPAERAVTFAAQPVWKRAAIVAAGPIANFILAIAIFSGSFYVSGRPILIPRIETVVPNSPAARAGFQPGDVVLGIDGTPINSFTDMQKVVSASGDIPLRFEVQRGTTDLTLTATPERKDVSGPFGSSRVGVLGLTATGKPEDWKTETYTAGGALKAATSETWFVVDRTLSYIGGLFVGRETASQISGPIRIAEVSGEVAKLGLGALINLAAFLSVSIGFVNLLPVPLLDGGHLMYYLVEAARGRPMSERAQEIGFRFGLAIVSSLMIFATFNDVLRLVHG
ncbi:RIP metalloprotease RseP [Lichenihabitans sp. Uapishka_5]|uniref:RIP metalloprotease RseP n=1 Tax=Lichenihabitans sp. Uapishka_5 TaxID=3037302 RepID=UPI0029E7F879|nr:RIP metalloprotease RseP [Lichenihabitans sp. Uapishka_5]MDX7952002.1 RIP metalloprotease RseP [Lichenihabitans sp. Uapishka_5]